MHFRAKHLQKLGIGTLEKLQPRQTNALSQSHCFSAHPAFGGHCNGPSPAEFIMPKEMMFICPQLSCLGVRDRQQHKSVIHSTFPSSPASPKPCLCSWVSLWKCLKVTVLNAIEIFLLLQLYQPQDCACSAPGKERKAAASCLGATRHVMMCRRSHSPHPQVTHGGEADVLPSTGPASLPCQAPPDVSSQPCPPPLPHTRAIQVKVQIQSHLCVSSRAITVPPPHR